MSKPDIEHIESVAEEISEHLGLIETALRMGDKLCFEDRCLAADVLGCLAKNDDAYEAVLNALAEDQIESREQARADSIAEAQRDCAEVARRLARIPWPTFDQREG